jgi:hypothetical protein
MEARIRSMAHLYHVPMLHRVGCNRYAGCSRLIADEMFPKSILPSRTLVPFSAARVHPFRSIESRLEHCATIRLMTREQGGRTLISGRQCPEGMHVVRRQHPNVDHKRMGQRKRCDRFPQGRAHIRIGEKRLTPIGVAGEEIGATRHMGATVIRHHGIIPPMSGAGTRATLAWRDNRQKSAGVAHRLEHPVITRRLTRTITLFLPENLCRHDVNSYFL